MGTALQSSAQARRRATVRADGSPARVTKRRGETRARLLDAAFAAFAEMGFGRVSIEDVCKRAGFTRGAFYSNFDTLDELFFALYEQRAHLIAAQITESLTAGDGLTDAALVARIVEALLVDRDWILVKTDFLLHAARTPAVAARLSEHRDRLRATLSDVLAARVAAHDRPQSMRTADGLARAVVAVHDGAMNQLLLDPHDNSFRGWLTDLIVALLGPGDGTLASGPGLATRR
jgi:AcrR family transcriptional regulator